MSSSYLTSTMSADRKHNGLSLLDGESAKLFLEHVGTDVDSFAIKANAQPKWAQETIMTISQRRRRGRREMR